MPTQDPAAVAPDQVSVAPRSPLAPAHSVHAFSPAQAPEAHVPQPDPPTAQPTAGPSAGSPGAEQPQTAHTPLPAASDVANGVADASPPGDTAPGSSEPEPGHAPAATDAPPAHAPDAGAGTGAGAGPASAPPPNARTEAHERPKAAGEDRASLATSTHTHTRTPSTRRKENKSASEMAHTASTLGAGEPRKARPARKARGSLFARIFHVLVPCVGPSARAHELDIEKPSEPPLPQPVVAPAEPKEKEEKEPAKPAESAPPLPAAEPQPPTLVPVEAVLDEPSQPEPSTSTQFTATEETQIPPPLQAIDIPPPSDDPAVVVPPTPTKILPPEETGGVLSGAVQPPGSTGEESIHDQPRQRDSDHDSDGSTSFTEDEDMEEGVPIDEVEDEEERLILNGGAGIPIGPSIQQADYVVPVEIEYHWHNVYVIKRPGVDNFLKKMGEIYEVVVFTASLSKYADPVLDKLDINHVVAHRLFRESCYNHRGNYVKDLSQLGRPIADTIIIDNSPASYIFHPNNAVPVSSWFNDPHDTELTDLVPFLADLGQVDDVRGVLDGGL
ncbi:hypothetical protein EIP86_005080 [Pleurotus ostreatoroseus]|nr:hypothetical protein EIP86_005080 [Pleurotus ostreatoroseus]